VDHVHPHLGGDLLEDGDVDVGHVIHDLVDELGVGVEGQQALLVAEQPAERPEDAAVGVVAQLDAPPLGGPLPGLAAPVVGQATVVVGVEVPVAELLPVAAPLDGELDELGHALVVLEVAPLDPPAVGEGDELVGLLEHGALDLRAGADVHGQRARRASAAKCSRTSAKVAGSGGLPSACHRRQVGPHGAQNSQYGGRSTGSPRIHARNRSLSVMGDVGLVAGPTDAASKLAR